jgi:hypothetical protein
MRLRRAKKRPRNWTTASTHLSQREDEQLVCFLHPFPFHVELSVCEFENLLRRQITMRVHGAIERGRPSLVSVFCFYPRKMHGRVMLEVEMKQHSAADVAGGGEDLALLDEGEKLDREHHPTSSSARATRSTLVGGEVEEEGEDVAEGDALIPAALTDGEGGQRPGIPAMGDEQPILTAADFVAWGKRTWWMPDGITDMLGGTLWTWSENIFRGRGGYGAGSLVIVFCIFSARTFVVPLWTGDTAEEFSPDTTDTNWGTAP